MGNSPKIFITRAESTVKGMGEIELDGILVRAVWGIRNRNALKIASVEGIFEGNQSRDILR